MLSFQTAPPVARLRLFGRAASEPCRGKWLVYPNYPSSHRRAIAIRSQNPEACQPTILEHFSTSATPSLGGVVNDIQPSARLADGGDIVRWRSLTHSDVRSIPEQRPLDTLSQRPSIPEPKRIGHFSRECWSRVSLPPPEIPRQTISEPISIVTNAAVLCASERRPVDLAVRSPRRCSLFGSLFSKPHDFGHSVPITEAQQLYAFASDLAGVGSRFLLDGQL